MNIIKKNIRRVGSQVKTSLLQNIQILEYLVDFFQQSEICDHIIWSILYYMDHIKRNINEIHF